MNVLSIIVTYNRKKLLAECITALKNQTYPTDILVIDNNSNDGTADLIKTSFQDVLYVNTLENLGGAGGFHYGLNYAFTLDKEYDSFWIMDDDTIPKETTLEKIMEAAKKDPNYGFISVKTLWTDGSLCKMNLQTKLQDGKKIDEHTQNYELLECCTFVGCFLNKSAVLEVGLPLKQFFIWCDDTEYTRRISKKYTCYYLNNCEIIHKMANNHPVKIEDDTHDRIPRYFYFYRNRFYIAKKSGLLKVVRYHGMIIKHLLLVLIKSKKDKWFKIKHIFKGYFAGLFFHPTIEYVKESSH